VRTKICRRLDRGATGPHPRWLHLGASSNGANPDRVRGLRAEGDRPL